jgi:hypothetical protein
VSQAISTASFIGSLGVNTHLDFGGAGYGNVTTVINAIKYLGIGNLRDSAANSGDYTLWQQVAQATGVKFDAYIGETSPAGMSTELALIPQLAKLGILNFIEGGNEEDDAYPASLGNTLAITAQFQHQVWSMGQQLGLPVINMSFGAGWTYLNNWHGNYDKVGDLSAYTDYGNAHTYPGVGQTQDSTIQMLNADAKLAAASRPVITTELGWDENTGFNQTQVAKNLLAAALDGIKDGNPMTYFYAMFNDGSGNFGLMNTDGSAKPAGQALHNLTTILKDSGGNFTPGSLNYSINTADNTLLMEKSDGSYWLSIWNESAGAHSVTLTLGSAASTVAVYDPLTGTNAVQSASNAKTITLTVPDHPVIVQIGGGAPPATSPTPTPTPTTTPSPTPSPTPTTTNPQDTVLTVPAAKTVTAGSATPIGGISVSDPWALSNGGSMALNVWDKNGSFTLNGRTYGPGGSAVVNGMVSGSLSQINAALAGLTYTAPADGGSDTITIDIWNPSGYEVTKTITIDAKGTASPTPTPTPNPSPSPTPTPTATGPQDLALVLPTSAPSVASGSSSPIGGVSISDPWASTNTGSMALNVWDSKGTLLIGGHRIGPNGGPVANGTISGSLAQLNAALAGLTYTAPAGSGTDTITIDVWNQAGVEATRTLTVTYGGTGGATSPTPTPTPTTSPTPTPTPTQPGIVISPTDSSPTISVSNTSISATGGDHMIFIAGTNDVLTATGGTETVQAYQGGNRITTGAGNDTIRFAGSNNVIDAGGGRNVLADSGSNNTIVLPGANQGFDDIYGYMMTNGDRFDLRSALADTSWNHDLGTIGNFVKVAASGGGTMIAIDPTGQAGGASYNVAMLESAGSVSLQTLLAHSITS